ncbi:acetyltransferase [Haloferax sp. MBLA0076]|uniref:Acetyltransferase n=1 Tax=Haloferax litoreum TaxID=2666140 RepID=A0A6A8GGM8_9EURY|nr:MULTISPECIES: arylamine N-acetyltransferase [Haloferax]KAB1193786.1 arylamine N-acetyltransferase [Haloferax sp. CBA1148]MRX22323.1 acetyltransferase [Haloferax litoreum]
MTDIEFPPQPRSSDEVPLETEIYLARLSASVDDSQSLDVETLAALQANHLLSVPFENVDVVRGTPIELDLQSTYEKVVDRGRGGFCYELNSLFGWLLATLGFETRLVEGRVRDDGGSVGPPFDHMALLVALDQPYLVDVGFGQFTRRPLPLTSEPVTDVSGTYRVLPPDTADHPYAAQRLRDDEWVTAYEFTTASRSVHDFEEMCTYQQTSSDSNFTGGLLATVATPTGRLTLSDETLTVTEHGQKRTTDVESPAHRDALLKSQFWFRSPEDN